VRQCRVGKGTSPDEGVWCDAVGESDEEEVECPVRWICLEHVLGWVCDALEEWGCCPRSSP